MVVGDLYILRSSDQEFSGTLGEVEAKIDDAIANQIDNDLWAADPNCLHVTRNGDGGGVVCTKCRGWFCF